jgi:hypothetical protein
MGCFTCGRKIVSTSSAFAALSRAAAKATSARLRRLGARAVAPDWAARAVLCERCPLRVVRDGVSYCGQPFLRQIDRDPAADGCGCPTREKARSPSEHCPLDAAHRPAVRRAGRCNCKWCGIEGTG